MSTDPSAGSSKEPGGGTKRRGRPERNHPGSLTLRRQLRTLTTDFGVSRTALLLLGIASIAAGLTEAAALTIVVQAAASVASENLAPIDFGPFSLQDIGISVLLAIGVGFAALRLGLQIVVAWIPARLCADSQALMQTRLLGAYLNARWGAQATEREGRLQEVVTSRAAFAMWVVRFAGNATSSGLSLVALAASALIVSPLAAMVMAALALSLFALLRPLAGRARRLAADRSAASLTLAEGVSETVRMSEVIQAYAVEEPVRRRTASMVAELMGPSFRAQFLAQLVSGAYQTLALVFVFVGLGVLSAFGTRELASLGAVVLMLMRCLSYGQQFQSAYHQLNDLWVSVDLVLQTEQRLKAAARPASPRSLGTIERISFDRVSFAYDDGCPVLRELSFDIGRGEAVGIKGASGVGKSTLIQVLLRLRRPQSGRYSVNGCEADEFTGQDWFARVAYLPQDPQLIAGTVADNIRFFRPAIDEDAVEAAARAAGIHEEISSWAAGYGTTIGQRTDAVSGGQRQRLCLARALAGRPEVLVLDEPTGALDGHSEAIVRRSLESLKGQVTLIVVAHQPSTLDLCDRLIVLDASPATNRNGASSPKPLENAE